MCSSDLLEDTLTGETGHYLVAHSTPGTEERTSTLYDADGNAVMTFPYAVNATLSGGLLILRDDADVWAFENGTTGGTRVYDLATGAQLPVPETALDCLVVDEGGQRLVFNCYDLPEGLTYAYDDPDQPLHQYVLITDREGNVLLREDGCTASSLASYRGGFADWLDLSWFRGSDWGIAREALYNVTTGELLTGEEDSAVSACGVGVACLQSRQNSRSVLYDLNGSEAVELGRFDWAVNTYTPGCVVLSGSDDPDSPYTLIDLASGESIGVQRYDADYHSGNVAVLTTDNILKVYDGTTGALLTDVEAAPVEEAQYISVTALPDGYALLQYDDETTTPSPSRPTAAKGCSGRPPVRPSSTPTLPTSPAPPAAPCSQPTGTAVMAAASTMCWTWRAICFSAASAAATARTTFPTTALSRGRASTMA